MVKDFKLAQNLATQTQVLRFSVYKNAIYCCFTDGSGIYVDKIQKSLYTSRSLRFRKMDLEPTQFASFPPSEQELKLVLFYPQDQNPSDEPVLMYVTENPTTGETFMDFFMETSNTYYQFPIFQMPHDDRIPLTPTSCQFSSYKVHRTQGTCLLF